jgi:hypothetical protein
MNCDNLGLIDERDRKMVEKGLTMEFRESDVYKKMVADILRLAPDASGYEVDTIIWWYMSRPDLYDCDEGKYLLREMENRVKKYSSGTGYKELEQDVFSRTSIPESEHEPLRDDSGVYSSESGTNRCTDGANSGYSESDVGDELTDGSSDFGSRSSEIEAETEDGVFEFEKQIGGDSK